MTAQSASQFFSADSTGSSASVFNFPASGSAVDGQEVTIGLEGATAAQGINLAPGTSNFMADPNNPGQYGGSGVTLTVNVVGAIIRLKYDNATHKWKALS